LRLLAALRELVKGWVYFFSFLSGSGFIRQARIRKGKHVKVSPTATFKYPELISIGDNSFINHGCCLWASPNGPISIGRDVLLGPHTCLISSNHGIASDMLIREQAGVDAPIVIGDDVWLGANVVVTGGTVIGSGCVVGGGAVVTKDLPPLSICVGVPAKVIGYRKPGTSGASGLHRTPAVKTGPATMDGRDAGHAIPEWTPETLSTPAESSELAAR
jgi:maltose O-acetyltransferase